MIFNKIFGVKSAKKDNRQAFRVAIPNLRAKLAGRPMSFSVRDLSATGVALNVNNRVLAVNSRLEISLFCADKMLIGSLHVRVVRLGKGFVGMVFENLNRQQSKMLHELCLEEQKRLADIKKKKTEQQTPEPEAAEDKANGAKKTSKFSAPKSLGRAAGRRR
jgi:c-di-GMP-binding flagellar brake protein YcgR